MWSALGIREHKALWGAGSKRAILNGGLLNSSKWLNLHQMSYIRVIGEECRIHGAFPHKRKGKTRQFPVLHYIWLAPLTGLSGCYCCSGSLREEHSNDLVTVIRKTMSPASLSVPTVQTHTESRASLPGAARVDRQEKCTYIQYGSVSCILPHFFWWDAWAINKSWSIALCADGLNPWAKVERLMSTMHVRVWLQCVKPVTTLALSLGTKVSLFPVPPPCCIHIWQVPSFTQLSRPHTGSFPSIFSVPLHALP